MYGIHIYIHIYIYIYICIYTYKFIFILGLGVYTCGYVHIFWKSVYFLVYIFVV